MNDATTAVGGRVLGVIPHLTVRGASEAIAFYERAFGAKEITRMPSPDGARLWHASISIGPSTVYLVDEFPEHGGLSPAGLGGSPVSIHIEVEDADAFFARAVEAGATVTMPLMDAFWGSRFGKVADPYGYHWSISHKIEDVDAEKMQERMAAMTPNAECAAEPVAV